MRGWRVGAGSVLVLVGVVGCGGGPEPSPQPTPTESPAPEPNPTRAPVPADPVGARVGEVLDLADRREADPEVWSGWLADGNPRVRARAARAVGQLRDPALASALLARLKEEDAARVRVQLVFALGQLGDESAREPLTRLLDDPALAAEAATALGKLPLSPSTVLALTRCAIPSEREGLAEAALLALVKLRGRRAKPDSALDPDAEAVLEGTLARLITHDDEGLRWRAVYALSEIELPGRRELLQHALKAADPASRLFAARGLGRLGPIEGGAMHAFPEIDLYAAALEAEADPHVAAALCSLLGAYHLPYALPTLEQVCARAEQPHDHHVRAAALEAIQSVLTDMEGEERIADEDVEHGRRAYRQALRDPSPRVRRAALTGLTRLRALDAPGRVAAFARHDDVYDRMAAAACGPELPDEAAAPLLTELARDAHPGVVCAALAALGERAGRAGDGHAARQAQAAQASRHGLKHDDLAVRAVSLALLAEVGSGDDVLAISWAYQRAADPKDVEVRQEALSAAGLLALRLREQAANQFSAAFRAQVHVATLLQAALADPAPSVRAIAADHLEALFEERPAVPPPPATQSSVAIVPGQDVLVDGPNPRVTLETTRGRFTLELFREQAPRHVASFLGLAEGGTYDDLLFHRVVSGFVVQGLDPRGDGWGTGGVVLHDEINRARFETGALGMPNSGPDTGGCQVFITHVPTPHLDGAYTVFGRVVEGMDVIHALDVGDRCLGVAVAD